MTRRWKSCPIDPSWITEGTPRTYVSPLADSRDGSLSVGFWRCTAGRFTWRYSVDEDICILEGSALIRGTSGVWQHVRPGDSVTFPKGSTADWIVDDFVRKVYAIRMVPTPLLQRVTRKVHRFYCSIRTSKSEPT